jgi:hypothetical protein
MRTLIRDEEMTMEKKIFEFEIKELTEEGRFSGYLSTFGNVDAGGDMVDPGAFKKTLRDNKAFGFVWGHEPRLDGIIGSFTGKEDVKGLFVEGGFYLDLDGGIKAYKTSKRLQSDGVKIGLSMGYRAVKWAWETVEGITVRRLKEVKLNEGSITLFPMNDQTNLSVKETDGDEETETKPYPNEHACRLNDPGKYERFVRIKRKHNGKEYSAIIGFKKGGGSEDQAYRYPKDTWSETEARAHCKDHDGSFEAAKKPKELTFVCKSCGETLTLTQPADATEPGAEPSPEPGDAHSKETSLLDSVIEGLEEKKAEPQRPFWQTIDTLEKP